MKKIVCNIILSIVTFVALLIYNNDFLNGNSYNIFITLLFFAISKISLIALSSGRRGTQEWPFDSIKR